jgi:hypothetical protein
MSEDASGSPVPWNELKAWDSERLSRDTMVERLKQRGLTDESIQVLLNALPSASAPPAVPDLKLDWSQNALAPASLSVFELGLSGGKRTIALYWLVFGSVLFTLSASLRLACDFELLSDGQKARWISTFGLWVSALALAEGFRRLFQLWLMRRAPTDGSDFRDDH